MKFEDLPKTDKRGRKLELENGRVVSVSIDNENHGCLTAWLELKIGRSGGCNFGGYKLGNAFEDQPKQPGPDYCAIWLRRCINTLTDDGLGKWEKLAGLPCRVLHEGLGGGVVAIGHLLEDKWFCPKVEFEKGR